MTDWSNSEQRDYQVAGPTQVESVCPRHPDRPSYVRCQRCGQPVCPECMRPAAVGVQCVDCVRQGQVAMAPTRRNAIGAQAIARPYVTYTVIGLCVVMFVLQMALGNAWTNRFMFVPSIGAIEPWRFLTAAFLHSPGFIGHILFNMLAFWQCGNVLERVLGHTRFIMLCLVSALAGSVVYLALAGGPGNPVITGNTLTGMNPSWGTPVLGASGMVFGLFGALIPIMRKAGSSARQIWILLAINAALGFVIPNIAWQAHLGGFLFGFAMSWGYSHWGTNRTGGKDRRTMVAWVLPTGFILALSLIAFLVYQLTGWLALIS